MFLKIYLSYKSNMPVILQNYKKLLLVPTNYRIWKNDYLIIALCNFQNII